MAPVTARHSPVTAALAVSRRTSGRTVSPAAPDDARTAVGTSHNCIACGVAFTAIRPAARCCSGRCRILLSRTRRVADLVRRLEAAEAAEAALVAAEQGGAKVAP